jgi:hypothetical protein
MTCVLSIGIRPVDKRLVKLIERAVRSTETLFPLNAGWQCLHREYNIGATLGNKIRVSARDKKEMIGLVKQVTGLDLRKASVDGFASLSRSEALERTRDEKWAGRKVSADRLAVKAMPGKLLSLNGQALALPNRCHLDIAGESLNSLEHEAILVVENYECFDRIDQISWALDEPYSNPLANYRGDPHTSNAQAVNEFLRGRKTPVLAMTDLDPAGLLISQSLPNLTGLVAPDFETLERLFALGNPDLYHKQRPGTERILENSPHPIIRRVWELIELNQKAIVQERWLRGDVELVDHSFSSQIQDRN